MILYFNIKTYDEIIILILYFIQTFNSTKYSIYILILSFLYMNFLIK